jgi:hypothetical protein
MIQLSEERIAGTREESSPSQAFFEADTATLSHKREVPLMACRRGELLPESSRIGSNFLRCPLWRLMMDSIIGWFVAYIYRYIYSDDEASNHSYRLVVL